MYFVSPLFLVWSRKDFNQPRPPRQNEPANFNPPSERELMASADKHHAEAVNTLQKAKRLYFLERGPFL